MNTLKNFQVKKCNFCGGRNELLYNHVYRCTKCRHIIDFSYVNCNDYAMDYMRNTMDYAPPKEIDYIRMKDRWDFVLRHAKGCKSLIDYGCGNNLFIESAKPEYGFEKLVPFDTNWITGYYDERKLDDEYDVMTMWHVLEHILNPTLVLNRIKHKYLFVIIPWAEYLDIDKLPSFSLFFAGRHFNMFTRESLFKLLKGYTVLEENYNDAQFLGLDKDIVGFALKRNGKRFSTNS